LAGRAGLYLGQVKRVDRARRVNVLASVAKRQLKIRVDRGGRSLWPRSLLIESLLHWQDSLQEQTKRRAPRGGGDIRHWWPDRWHSPRKTNRGGRSGAEGPGEKVDQIAKEWTAGSQIPNPLSNLEGRRASSRRVSQRHPHRCISMSVNKTGIEGIFWGARRGDKIY